MQPEIEENEEMRRKHLQAALTGRSQRERER